MKKVVLIIDPPKKIEYVSLSRHDMEGYTPLEITKTKEALETFSECVLYTKINKFLRHYKKHKNDLIFPMVWGKGERNAKAILPAICESRNLKYIGADVYGQTICYDKFLAKKYSKAFGFNTPNSLLFFNFQQEKEIERMLSFLNLPLVIKPNFGGGSCGISENNLVDSYKDATILIRKLFTNKYNPILVEEYIAGNEVSILLLGNNKGVKYCGETQLVIDNETFFEHRIWGYETKKMNFLHSHYQVCNLISNADLLNAKKLFLSLPKVEYLRIDGRLNSNGFFVIELSADCYLGPNCDFQIMFENMGKTYVDLLKFLVENALLS